jgi:hypothetical protein
MFSIHKEQEMKSRDAFWPLLAAILSLAVGALPAEAQTAEPGRDPSLVAHWRTTRIVFDSSRDENMVLRDSGSAEKWTVTASGRSPTVKGQWSTQGRTLKIDWEDGEHWSRPFTFHEGQLVFPNIPKQRKFWDRLQ